ncbi:MAG: glutaminyl-peptide cyclotransferase [Bacteroidales bacterium]|jgi:glutamine cyclotransferase|nr:glutaminyl-peptide cyclotransferase [Bacteroidales bacterium]
MKLVTKLFTCIAVSSLLIIGCNNPPKKYFTTSLVSSTKIAINDTVLFSVTDLTSKQIDSLVVTIGSFSRTLPHNAENIYNFALHNTAMGELTVYISLFADELIEKYSHNITVVSDIEPKIGTYRIIRTFPRDDNFYTQGLEFVDNILYESAGEYGKSRLRKTDFNTGKTLAELPLEAQFFGEGLTILNNHIYQLTWQEKTGFIYDLDSFQPISSFAYGTEGWGLTNDGKNLIMSDGSEFLYILNPENLHVITRMAVYDNSGAVQRLNELEYVDGVIFANIYTTDFIVAIDAATGKVLTRYNFKNLLAPQYRTATTDVLNGIAYNKERGTFFITGKNWSKLFEVVLD